ncbi:HDIG domain-containing protein [Candidatus Woesearchaeota archaeon]|nr:HDIG domain-containing protein [Candidatus Woesearchaeota archaeon]
MIPDPKQCMKILEEHDVVAHIIEHSQIVSKVAVFLAKELKKTGEKINIPLLEAAALLHDLDKLKTNQEPENHGKLAFELLRGDHPEVAELIPKHCFPYLLDNQLKTWEEKLLNYADMRVLHNELVTREERHEDAKRRYPDETGGRRDEAEKEASKIEKEIFTKINLKPHKLAQTIEEEKEKQRKLKALKRKQKQEVKEEAPAASEKEEEVAGKEEIQTQNIPEEQ